MNWKVLAAVALIVVGVGAVGMVIVNPFAADTTTKYITAQAARETVAQQAVATGTIGSAATYGLAFGQPAQLVLGTTTSGTTAGGGSGSNFVVQKVNVKVGDAVKAGQVLATADATDLATQLAIAKANLAAARARLSIDQAGATGATLASAADSITQAQLAYQAALQSQQDASGQNTLTVAQAQQALTNAQNQLATDQAGPDAATLAQAKDAVNQAQLAYQQALQSQTDTTTQNNLAVTQAQQAVAQAQENLFACQNQAKPDPAGCISEGQAVTTAQLALQALQTKNQSGTNQSSNSVAQAQLALQAAQDAYTAKVTPSQATITADQIAVTNAEANLQSAQLKVTTTNHQNTTSLAQAQASLQSARDAYAAKVAPATAATLTSDQAAVVSAQSNVTSAAKNLGLATIKAPIDGIVDEVNVVAGALAPSGYAIVMQSGQLQATADFAESSLPSLTVGQPATVQLTAGGQSLTGTVTEITPVPTTSGTSSVVTYAVVVSLDNAPASVLSGMSANVDVTTAQAPNVIAVPAISLVGRNGNYGVRVLGSNGAVSLVPVQVGLVTSSLAEITSGITEGQAVVIGTSSPRTGTSTTTAGGGFGGGFGGLGGGDFIRAGGGTRTGGNAGAGGTSGGAPQP